MILEKLEQITLFALGKGQRVSIRAVWYSGGCYLPWWRRRVGIAKLRKLVNDPIAISNALVTVQVKLVPFSEGWQTGISLLVQHVENVSDSIFPVQEYDWNDLDRRISDYVAVVMKSLPFG